jgi:hypothetical protein
MDVSALVSQMHEALSTIHSTLASLDTKTHDDRLDELERQRDSSLATLRKAFEQEGGLLAEKRKAEQDEIAERRRKEDEERERRRKLEDEQIAARDREQDEQREHQLQIESQDVEEETEGLMNDVEADAIRLLEQGRERLRVLEEHRKVLSFFQGLQHRLCIDRRHRRSTASSTNSSRRHCRAHRHAEELCVPAAQCYNPL